MRCAPPPFRAADGVVRYAGEGADFAYIPRLPMNTGAFGARVGWLRPRSTLGLGRVKTSAPKALREAGIPIVAGNFPGLSPEQARGMVWPSGRHTHRRDQRLDSHDVHDPREIVSQHVQGHLGG